MTPHVRATKPTSTHFQPAIRADGTYVKASNWPTKSKRPPTVERDASTREHNEGSQGRGQSKSRGRREADNDDSKDDDDDHAHVVPQNPQATCQMAYNEATDTSNPNVTSARPTEPVGTSNGLLNKSNEGEEKQE
ncbi:hypothetical protein BDN67DRAFT_971577 [Paxillus ammoniavirescens]|nr:hypothetical protein BDN67DRAFT_971577 [Paxillus ammoniavirescens]